MDLRRFATNRNIITTPQPSRATNWRIRATGERLAYRHDQPTLRDSRANPKAISKPGSSPALKIKRR
jgi:hypothetical protein